MEKLSRYQNDEWVDCRYEPEFINESLSGVERIVAAVPRGIVAPFAALVTRLHEPFLLLYVLHTPRGEGSPGRYQSPEISQATLLQILEEYGSYLGSDARFDLWVYSPTEKATVVWDRHNLIYAYGPIQLFAETLKELGYKVAMPIVPSPHQHHYRQEFDMVAGDLLARFSWSHSDLHPADEQWVEC
jgi:hypothetical protein